MANGLLVKYGLRNTPSEEAAQKWARRVRELINGGMSRDVAGDTAAKEIFPDYHTHVYASEADTIEMLLQQVADRK